MTRLCSRTLGAALALCLLHGATGAGQTTRPGQRPLGPIPAELLERPVPLREGIGFAHEAATTTSDRAHAYCDQGLAYLHSYVWIEAARSFNQALRIDRNLAMAYLGLSYALGELGASEGAREASQRASALAGTVTEREQARIAVRSKQLAASAQPDNPTLRAEYERELDRAVVRHPDDVELLLLRGHADDGAHDSHGMGGGNGSIRFYERALALRPDYFPTHHYLAHAYENVGQMDRALDHAGVYARAAPAVPHAHHMHGHVLRRVDRMNEAIAEFRRADELEMAYFKSENIPPEYDWHYHHNLDLLGTAYEYVGQMRSAEPILRRSFDLRSIELSQELNEKAWPMFLLARGRADEALAASRALVGRSAPLVQALGHLLTSRVLMALHRMDDATEEGDAGLRQMRASGAVGGVLVPELQLTQGELLLRTGQAERGRAMFLDALAKVRAERGPDAWIQALFSLEAAGRIAREAGGPELAAGLAEQMRQYDSSYAGTHYALGLAAEQRGDFASARAEYGEAVRRWASADASLPDLADAKRRLAAMETAGGHRDPR